MSSEDSPALLSCLQGAPGISSLYCCRQSMHFVDIRIVFEKLLVSAVNQSELIACWYLDDMSGNLGD